MSTRCQIGVYEKKSTPITEPTALLHKYSDGHPTGDKGVIDLLQEFFRTWSSGHDDEYLAAQLLSWLTKGRRRKVGYGICREMKDDISFFYAIYPTKIKVYRNTPKKGSRTTFVVDRVDA